jgi:hypothetical protein
VIKKLRFMDLTARHPGVSPGVSLAYAEAASVCLARHHTPPCQLAVLDGSDEHQLNAEWKNPTQAVKNAWANKDDATRDGAYALALASLEVTRGLVALSRAETRTGADYYVGSSSLSIEDFESCYRLEVSGTDEGNSSAINRRLQQKLDQAKNGNSNLPAIASIVGFSALRIVSADLEST